MSENSKGFEQQYSNYFESGGDAGITEAAENTESVETNDSSDEQETTTIELESENESNDETTTDNESEQTEENDVDYSDEESELEEEQESDEGQEEQPESDKSTKMANNLKAALKEERNKRKEQDKKFNDLQAQTAKLQDALTSLMNPNQQMVNQKEVSPDYESDPIAYLKWQNEQLTQNVQQQQQYLSQQGQNQQAQQQAMTLNNEYIAERQEYAKENPEFDGAAGFLEESVVNEYKALGYNDQQTRELLLQDKLSLLNDAKQRNMSAPELIMNIARARGFQVPKTIANKSKPQLETINQGMKKGKSLGSTGGESGSKKITLDELSRLNDKEFEKMFKKYAKGEL